MANDAQIQTLIAELAKNTAALERQLARDPAKEYVYGEGNVGAKTNFSPCEKMENLSQLANAYDAAGYYYLSASLYPQFWEFGFRIWSNNGALPTPGTQPHAGVKIDFDNQPNFPRPTSYIRKMELSTLVGSYTLNTGSLIYDFNIRIPIRKRYARFAVGDLGGNASNKLFTVYPPTSFTANFTALACTVFGD